MVVEKDSTDVNEEFREAQEKTKVSPISTIKKLPIPLVILSFIFTFFLFYQTYWNPVHPWAKEVLVSRVINGVATQVKEYVMSSQVKLFLGIMGLVFLIILFSANKELKPISDREAKEIVRRDVLWKMENTGEFPQGKYIQYPDCDLPDKFHGKGEKFRKWFVYFGIEDKAENITKWFAKVDPYLGLITSYNEAYFGYDKSVTKDQIVIIPEKHSLAREVERKMFEGK